MPTAYRLEPRHVSAPGCAQQALALPKIVRPVGPSRSLSPSGMSADWGGLPADLGQAVLLLAAHYYEYRDETALGAGCMPFGVTSLIQRYRTLCALAPG